MEPRLFGPVGHGKGGLEWDDNGAVLGKGLDPGAVSPCKLEFWKWSSVSAVRVYYRGHENSVVAAPRRGGGHSGPPSHVLEMDAQERIVGVIICQRQDVVDDPSIDWMAFSVLDQTLNTTRFFLCGDERELPFNVAKLTTTDAIFRAAQRTRKYRLHGIVRSIEVVRMTRKRYGIAAFIGRADHRVRAIGFWMHPLVLNGSAPGDALPESKGEEKESEDHGPESFTVEKWGSQFFSTRGLLSPRTSFPLRYPR